MAMIPGALQSRSPATRCFLSSHWGRAKSSPTKFDTGASSRHQPPVSGLSDPLMQKIIQNPEVVRPLQITATHHASRDFVQTLLKNGDTTIISENHRNEARMIASV